MEGRRNVESRRKWQKEAETPCRRKQKMAKRDRRQKAAEVGKRGGRMVSLSIFMIVCETIEHAEYGRINL